MECKILLVLSLYCFLPVSDNAHMNVLGIYSICKNQHHRRNNFTLQGWLYNETATMYQATMSASEFTSYSNIDVCFNHTLLYNYLVDKLLTKSSYLDCKNSSRPVKIIDIELVFLHVPLYMFRMTQNILSTTDTMVIKFTKDFTLTTFYDDMIGFDGV